MRFIASLGLGYRDAIPAAVAVVEAAMDCQFVVLFLIDPDGHPLDAYLANPIPEAMEGFLAVQSAFRGFPDEPTLDKVVAAGLIVDSQARFRGPKLRNTRTYSQILRHFGIGLGLDLTVRDNTGTPLAILIANRPFDLDVWTSAEKSLLARFHDDLAAILTQPAPSQAWQWSEAPDRTGYLVADGEGAVLFAAGEANLLVAQFCGLRFTQGLAYRDLLVQLPAKVRQLVYSAAHDGQARAQAVSPWGQVTVQVLREAPRANADQPDRYQIILERRLSRAAVVAHNCARAPLSLRERELAFLLGMGEPADRAADQMNISAATLKAYAKSVYGKLAVTGRSEMIMRLREAF